MNKETKVSKNKENKNNLGGFFICPGWKHNASIPETKTKKSVQNQECILLGPGSKILLQSKISEEKEEKRRTNQNAPVLTVSYFTFYLSQLITHEITRILS